MYRPAFRDRAEYIVLSVAIVAFSSFVICLLMTLLIFVLRTLVIFLTVSAWRSLRIVNESTHAYTVILGVLVAVRISLQV